MNELRETIEQLKDAVLELRRFSEQKENKDKKYNIIELEDLISSYKQKLKDLTQTGRRE